MLKQQVFVEIQFIKQKQSFTNLTGFKLYIFCNDLCYVNLYYLLDNIIICYYIIFLLVYCNICVMKLTPSLTLLLRKLWSVFPFTALSDVESEHSCRISCGSDY